ncbi:hypothetical protein [Pseudanabaena sp. BC1403]|uniref:hypothetical protein n=1 Tax=Pseudanabaena sp. BC1403 TaxID=2043171 RepID=UPI000CD93EFE|nr:hypothetical protein [Pseudanabaena sp. BC1403]
MFLGDRGEVKALKSEIKALQVKITALEEKIEHQNKRILDHIRINLDYLKEMTDRLFKSDSKNRELIERAITVAEENQMQIGQIKNNQISIMSPGGINTVTDMSVNHINQNIDIDSKTKQTLAEAAKEIQDLLEQLSKIYPTTTTAEKGSIAVKAMEEIEKKPNTKSKILKALKVGGAAALMELTNNPIVKILTPMLESLLDNGQ